MTCLDEPFQLNSHHYKFTKPKTMTVQKDPNDKYSKYKVDLHCNEHHEEDEWDPKTEGKIADWHNRHQDKLLDKFCDDHPGSPQCKVFDD